MNRPYLSINGIILPEEKSLISVKDRGFRFGDGLFETLLIINGIIYNWEAHIERLEKGLLAIKINFDCHNLKKLSYELIKKSQIKEGYLRISISRGIGSVGYLPVKNIKPTLVIETILPIKKPKSPIKLCVSSFQKPIIKSLPINYKLMQGLNSTLVKMEAVENGCFDAVILNQKKQICETSSANIFWVKDDILFTPHHDCGLLLGTIREKILQISPIKTKLVKAKLSDLLNADEIFITNVAVGVLPVNMILEKKFLSQKYSKILNNLLNKNIQNYVKEATN